MAESSTVAAVPHGSVAVRFGVDLARGVRSRVSNPSSRVLDLRLGLDPGLERQVLGPSTHACGLEQRALGTQSS